ncbi:hypothetical protein HK100_000071 [Physocladia obscura]|uniref:Uncharacterized protein n=1 Tax=Physocladia obscura TaxID=109957 RepID=A0AAD5XFG8_9FUNG|nr:hypothetical protein HK100_000071 [Physocladia obscura]
MEKDLPPTYTQPAPPAYSAGVQPTLNISEIDLAQPLRLSYPNHSVLVFKSKGQTFNANLNYSKDINMMTRNRDYNRLGRQSRLTECGPSVQLTNETGSILSNMIPYHEVSNVGYNTTFSSSTTVLKYTLDPVLDYSKHHIRKPCSFSSKDMNYLWRLESDHPILPTFILSKKDDDTVEDLVLTFYLVATPSLLSGLKTLVSSSTDQNSRKRNKSIAKFEFLVNREEEINGALTPLENEGSWNSAEEQVLVVASAIALLLGIRHRMFIDFLAKGAKNTGAIVGIGGFM